MLLLHIWLGRGGRHICGSDDVMFGLGKEIYFGDFCIYVGLKNSRRGWVLCLYAWLGSSNIGLVPLYLCLGREQQHMVGTSVSMLG